MLLTPSETKSVASHNALFHVVEAYGQSIQELTQGLSAAREHIQAQDAEIKTLKEELTKSLKGTTEVAPPK